MHKNKIYKYLKISTLVIIILIINSYFGFAQIFDSSQSPLSVKWRQITAGGFKIIYPAEMEKEAQRMANTFTASYPLIGADYKQQKTRIPIILQNQGISANGFVQLAPKKSQFYTTPPQYFDSQDWLNNLTVHELRHVAQFDKITGTHGYPFPEEIHFAYLGASIPTWYLEGDAVLTETILTHSGRGRQPNLIMPYRASLLSGKNFSYSKAYFGSDKDQTPGYYQLGYLLVSKLREKYGKDINDQLLTDINKRPLRLYPFSSSLRKITTLNTNRFYHETSNTLKLQWQKQDSLTTSKSYSLYNRENNFATDYFLPVKIDEHYVLALKQSKAETSKFILIDSTKNEKTLFHIGYQEQPWFSYANHKIVWNETRYDPRYRQRSYSVICIYDFQTKKKSQITYKSRLFSPSLSADGKKLIAVSIDKANQSELVFVNLSNGKLTSAFLNDKNDILQTPALSFDGTKISWVSVSEKGKALWLKNSDGKIQKIIDDTKEQLSRPVFINHQIAFNAHYNGIDNVYSIDPQNKKIVALTAAKYGAFNPSFSTAGNSLFFNLYTERGYQIAETTFEILPLQENHFVYFAQAAQDQENSSSIFENIPDSTFESKPYKTFFHTINLHSVTPVTDEKEKIGLELRSNDLLNTTSIYGGASYNTNLKRLEYSAGLIYKALYPVFSINFMNRPRTQFYKYKNQINQANWREDYINFKVNLPLSGSYMDHNYSINPEVSTYYIKRFFEPKEQGVLRDVVKFPMKYRLNLNHTLRMAQRDIAPRFGQNIIVQYLNQPFDKNLKGELFSFESYFYFPGIAKNHSVMTSFNYQSQSGIFNGSTEIQTVFGYNQIKAKNLLKNSLLFNYRFPFLYPDLEIGPLAYIRNVRATLFSHYENFGIETNLSQPKTYGFELRSDMNLLRYQPVVDLGCRVIFVNKIYNQNPIFELLFNYSF
ncbi:TolB family protein [Pedobacter sp.]|uniref:TolB family protein n=1 Tax=Pedobacter sp. TaxID=1411316 RepID=UPI00396C3873